MEHCAPHEYPFFSKLGDLRSIREAAYILGSSDEIDDHYQLGIVYDVLTDAYLEQYKSSYQAISEADRVGHAEVRLHLSHAREALLAEWSSRAEEDAADIAAYIAARPGLIRNERGVVIDNFVVTYDAAGRPSILPTSNDEADNPLTNIIILDYAAFHQTERAVILADTTVTTSV